MYWEGLLVEYKLPQTSIKQSQAVISVSTMVASAVDDDESVEGIAVLIEYDHLPVFCWLHIKQAAA